MIKVSVIIPIYNMEMYLNECLESVVAQTLKDLEVICINDGSTDNSLQIIGKYVAKYSNIVVINQENCGVGKSRNNGIDVATGEFVAFMDPDDFYPENDILECLYNSAKENNVLICGGSLCNFRENTMIKEYYGWLKDHVFNDNGKMKYKQYQFFGGFSRFIYNLKFLKKNSLYFPVYTRYQDPPFFVRAMICADEFYVMKKITYCYRVGHKKNILTLKKTIDYSKGVLDVLTISREYELKKLHAITIEAMLNDLSPMIYKHIANGNSELHELAYKINSIIDIKLLPREKNKIENYFLLNPSQITQLGKRDMEKEVKFLATLQNYKEIVIYGAGKVGLIVGEYLKTVEEEKILCFAVTDETKNPSFIENTPVRNINELTAYRESALILIATYSNLHEEIRNTLEKLQFKNILAIRFDEFQLFGLELNSTKN